MTMKDKDDSVMVRVPVSRRKYDEFVSLAKKKDRRKGGPQVAVLIEEYMTKNDET